MSPLTKPRKTVEDYLALPEHVRAELIEGELFMMTPSAGSRHQVVVDNLHRRLSTFVADRRLGRALTAPLDVHLPSGDVVQPDVMFIAAANAGIVQDWIRGVPDLLVEIISPEGMERDQIVKRTLYERNGVKEYWILDPQERSVEIFRLDSAGGFQPAGYLQLDDAVTTSLLPGCSLPVRDLFE